MERLRELVVVIQLRTASLRDKQRNERGSTATEYAMLVGFVALLIVLGVLFFGGQLNSWFNTLGDHVGSASNH